MFAVVEISGRQFKVSPKEKVEVDLLDAEPGKTLNFSKVLLIAESDSDARIGQPYLTGASVETKVLEHFKGEKIRVFKFRPKKRYAKTQGHRQNYTRLEVLGIKG
jgi:large subunit ribosomal protein L21